MFQVVFCVVHFYRVYVCTETVTVLCLHDEVGYIHIHIAVVWQGVHADLLTSADLFISLLEYNICTKTVTVLCLHDEV